MAQLSSYQQTRLDQAKHALTASLTERGQPQDLRGHIGAVEAELADMIRLVEQLTGNV